MQANRMWGKEIFIILSNWDVFVKERPIPRSLPAVSGVSRPPTLIFPPETQQHKNCRPIRVIVEKSESLTWTISQKNFLDLGL
jgi:hypothetical protein